jgi:amino acid adenylation domain-containing protein
VIIVPDNTRSAQLAAARQALLKKKLQQSSARAVDSVNTIPRRTTNAQLPLSSGQMRLWYLSQFEDSRAIHNIVTALRLLGPLDTSKLESAVNKVIARHEALRMHFSAVTQSGNQVELAILENTALKIEHIDLRTEYSQRGQRLIDDTIRELSLIAFDLECAPLIRVHCLSLSTREHILFISVHHAVFDGISQNIFLTEMFHHYASPEDSSSLPPPALQYGDYCVWEQDYFKTLELQKQLDYWLHQLSGDLPVLDLPLDMPRQPQQSFAGESQTLLLEPELLADLEKFAKTQNSTLFMLMLTVFYSLLYRYTGQRDFVVGTPIAGRSLPQLHNAIGYFVNTLPLRTQIGDDETFLELLKKVSDNCLSAYENQDVPFELLVEKLNPQRDLSRTPVYQAFFGFQLYDDINTGTSDLQCERLPLGTYLSRTDLSLWHERDESGIHLCAEYCSDLFCAETIKGFLTHYRELLHAVLKHSERRPALLPMLVDADYELLASRNQTDSEYTATSVIDMLSLQVAQNGKKIAVSDDNGCLSYEQLQLESSQLANHLLALGVNPGDCIGLCLNRSNTMLIAALAIWKAGAAYVPLDPAFPTQRLLYMLETANIGILVTESSLQDLLQAHDCERVVLDSEAALIAAANSTPAISNTPQSLAYVIFTSGSTGKPKGVKIPHGAISNFLLSMAAEPGLSDNDRLLAVTTLSFDIAVLELYLPLICGASVYIASKEDTMDGARLCRLIEQHSINVMQATPASWRLMLASNWQGTANFKVLCGGEAFPQDLAQQLFSRTAQVWNMYGPTETTVWSTCYRIKDPQAPVLIGQPIANTQCYVLDEQQQPVATGVAGELYIGGAGVSDGYIGRADLTAERFVSDPFRPADNARLYRTGDRVRWRHDGQLEYIERLDNQVKLRGFRIELGEIEEALWSHPQVAECAVGVVEAGESDQRLVAWLHFHSKRVDDGDLRAYLRELLPDYMVPTVWVAVEQMPLTPNSKIDRNALPRPDMTKLAPAEMVAPESAIEKQLAAIWRELFKLPQVGVCDNFFELGGHSLLGTLLFAKINRDFGIFLGLHELFRATTIRELAQRIEQASTEPQLQRLTIEHSPETTAPASSQQQRFWYLAQIHPEHKTHNLCAAWRLQGKLNVAALQQAFDDLLQRQQALSTRIVARDGRLIQEIQPRLTLNLNPVQASDPTSAGLAAMLEARRELTFDLNDGPLIRAGLIRINDEDHLVYLIVHHLVFDGQSFNVFYQELFQLYQQHLNGSANTLPELAISYLDYGHWQQQWLDSAAVKSQLDYWLNHLVGELPVLELPLDGPRPSEQPWQSSSVDLSLDKNRVKALQQLAASSGCSLFMVLLGLYALTLYRFSRQASMVVGIPISGRNLDELHPLVGFFVNTLALRLEVDPQQPFVQCLAGIKQTCLDAYNNPDVPFDLLVQELNPPRDQSRSPIYQTLFTYVDSSQAPSPINSLEIEPFELELPGAQTDIDFWIELRDNCIRGGMEYPLALFDASTIEAMARSFEQLSERVGEHPQSAVSELLQLTEPEKVKLKAWNSNSQEYPRNEIFSSHLTALSARRHGQRAIQFGTISLDYAALEDRSNQLAHYLLAAGVKDNGLVGVCLPRSHELLIAILAIWKTGAAYVPLDATYPQQRLRYMLETAAVPVLVTDSQLADTVTDYSCRRICIDTEQADIADHSKLAPELTIDPEAIAYVIFTSGSTGNPKGVQVPHRAVMNFLYGMASEPGLEQDDVLLAVTTLSFDIAVLELYLPLLVGATVVIADSEQAADGEQLKNLISEHQVTTLQATPSTWRLLLAAGWQGDDDFKALCGGEALPQDLADNLLSKAGQVWNMYGPTETTVWSTCYRVQSGSEPVYIGHPIANTQCHVLDQCLQRVPIGVAGELYIGGDGVTSGYLARPDLTAERFVDDPYRDKPGVLMYRTGDQVRWRLDGRLEYFRRMDDQVKLRGFRIELGEIESVLTGNPNIAQAAALLRSYGTTDQRLVAYVHFEDGASLTNTELRRYLRDQLPQYMIPQLFMELDRMPLTPNGKVDRKALPEPLQAVNQAREYKVPDTETEKQIASIWREVLGVEEFDVDQNFFDVGGHSLIALDVIYRIEAGLGVKVTPLDILLNSLGQMALQIDQRRIPEVGAALDANNRASAGGNGIISRLFTKKLRK